jgi:hypothetical protein
MGASVLASDIRVKHNEDQSGGQDPSESRKDYQRQVD